MSKTFVALISTHRCDDNGPFLSTVLGCSGNLPSSETGSSSYSQLAVKESAKQVVEALQLGGPGVEG